MQYSLAERIKARIAQMNLTPAKLAELAGLNRSFVYDIVNGRSENPNRTKLDVLAEILKCDRDWLLNGIGEIEGGAPLIENLDEMFVAVPYVDVRPSMGGGRTVEIEPDFGRPYHFQKKWIKGDLKADPASLRIMHVEGDSMAPTLNDGDTILVDTARKIPTPPGIFVLHDGMGLVAKRLEHIPLSDPPRVRVISDNPFYQPYECTADEVNIIGRIRWFAREM